MDPRRPRVLRDATLLGAPPDAPPAYLTLLRDPLARIRSLSAHVVRDARVASGYAGYLTTGHGSAMDNAQVRRWVTPGRGPDGGRVTRMMFDDRARWSRALRSPRRIPRAIRARPLGRTAATFSA